MREVVFPRKSEPGVSTLKRSVVPVAEDGVGSNPPGFAELSRRLVVALAFEFDGLLSHREIRAMVREAEARALETSLPLLALPALADERVQAAVGWHRRQRSIRERSVVSLVE